MNKKLFEYHILVILFIFVFCISSLSIVINGITEDKTDSTSVEQKDNKISIIGKITNIANAKNI